MYRDLVELLAGISDALREAKNLCGIAHLRGGAVPWQLTQLVFKIRLVLSL